MKNIFILKNFWRSFFVLIALIVIGQTTFSQSRVAFKPRTSQKAPGIFKGKENYNLQGDFVMIGNTNLTLTNYNLNDDNSSKQMKYVDVDNDNNTFNSSTATLQFNTNQPNCTKIIYAGLYWTGRAHSDNNNSPTTFTVTKQGGTKTFDKRKVKLKGPNGSYQEITANDNDIYYPTSGDRVMYGGYADVTDYVIAQGLGTYTVADIALNEGLSDGTGFYGGWGMVVIYENPTKVWRNITVFDGYSFIQGSETAAPQELAVSGFQSVKNGPVNVKMGLMAGEGDRGIPGDYFSIRNAANNNWVPLSHSGNTADNFFNSSIITDGGRNPNLVNNTGLDISMFNLTNTNNSILANNQTSTRFRYGSTGDTYSIFNIVFAVDAYVPEIQVYNANNSNLANGGSVTPNQNLNFTASVYNKGTEAINNGVVTIPLPSNVHYVSSAITNGTGTIPVGGGTVTWAPPAGGTNDATVTPGGTLTWNLGTISKPNDPNTLLAELKYTIRITNDCTILTTGGVCGLQVNLDGIFSGTGANSTIAINNGFVTGYNADCGNTPIRDPYILNIIPSQDFLNNCSADVVNGKKQFKAFCSINNNEIPRTTIANNYPAGTIFYSQTPGTNGYLASRVNGNFPVNPAGGALDYYAVLPGTTNGCYLSLQTVLEVVNTQPTATNLQYCVNALPNSLTNVTRSTTGVANSYQLAYFENGSNTPLNGLPVLPTVPGTYTYQVAEGKIQNGVSCFGPKVTFTIQVYALPAITTDLVTDFYACADETKSLVLASNATQVAWEYYNTTSATWVSLTNATYPTEVITSNTGLQFISPSLTLDQLRVRAKLTTANSCSIYSKEVTVEVRLCNIITNPMLPAKIIKN